MDITDPRIWLLAGAIAVVLLFIYFAMRQAVRDGMTDYYDDQRAHRLKR